MIETDRTLASHGDGGDQDGRLVATDSKSACRLPPDMMNESWYQKAVEECRS